MRRSPTLRARVVAGVLAVVVAALVVSGVTAVAAFRDYLLGQTDAELRTVLASYSPKVTKLVALSRSTDQFAPLTIKPGKSAGSSLGELQLGLPSVVDNYYLGFTEETSARLTSTTSIVDGNPSLVPRLPADLAAVHGAETVPSANGSGQLRLMAIRIGTAGILTATASLGPADDAIDRLRRIVIIGTLAAVFIVVVGTGLVVRRGLRPVEAMAAAADRITAGDLTTRVATEDPVTEMGHLGIALNGMLDRIESAVREREASEQATRRFFADASHELRTPLASLRANAELYQQGALGSGPQLDEAMRRITVEARRMGTLVDDMLRLARLDARPGEDHALVDLTALLIECADRASGPDRRLRVRVDAGMFVVGDREILGRAIGNLLSNVAVHTPPGTTVTLTGSANDKTVVIDVSDDGPGVPADQLDRIFDRFHRVPSGPHQPGSGLGLAIVAAAAASHGGSVRADRRAPHGLRVTVTLPGAARGGGRG
jgi:two-component system, OmpR family, sensor kinase